LDEVIQRKLQFFDLKVIKDETKSSQSTSIPRLSDELGQSTYTINILCPFLNLYILYIMNCKNFNLLNSAYKDIGFLFYSYLIYSRDL